MAAAAKVDISIEVAESAEDCPVYGVSIGCNVSIWKIPFFKEAGWLLMFVWCAGCLFRLL